MAEGNAERKEVEDYLRKHDLQAVLNEIINNTIKARSETPLEAIAAALKDRDTRGILAVVGREVLDSAGRPTVCVDVTTSRGTFTATVPPAPAAKWAAKELRDEDVERYAGGGVTGAVGMINEQIAPALIGMDPADQKAVDDKMASLDGTDDRSKFGANAMLAVSQAVCRAGAAQVKLPLYKHIAELAGMDEVCMPVPAFTVIEGGAAGDSNNPFKEYTVMPTSAETFSEALRIGVEVHEAVKVAAASKVEEGEEPPKMVKGQQGGWALDMEEYEEVLALLTEAVATAGYDDKVRFGMNLDGEKTVVRPPEPEEGEDAASVDPDEEKKYDLGWKDSDGTKIMDAEEFSKMLGELIEKYPIVSMEDPFCHEDLETYSSFTSTLGEDLQVVGDTLVDSSSKRIRDCEAKNLVNAITLRPIRIGTVTDCIAVVQQAQKLNWGVVVENMVVDTDDDFIADLSVGLRAGQFKAGAPVGTARCAKFNRLLRIEDELGEGALYVGNQFRRPPAP